MCMNATVMYKKLSLMLQVFTTTFGFSIVVSQHTIRYGQSMINLDGRWTVEGSGYAIISVKSSSITIDMHAFGRPTAHGSVLNASTITVNFPVDRTYTGKLEPLNKIRWSNGT